MLYFFVENLYHLGIIGRKIDRAYYQVYNNERKISIERYRKKMFGRERNERSKHGTRKEDRTKEVYQHKNTYNLDEYGSGHYPSYRICKYL